MNKQLTFFSGMLVTNLLVTLVAGCQSPENSAARPSAGSSRVVVVNASNAAAITALVDNVTAGSALAPGANAGYVRIPAGSVPVRIQGAGGTLGTSELSVQSTFLENTDYTVFVTDTISRPKGTDAGGVRTLMVTDTLTAPAAGRAKVRFFNLASDVAATSARLVNAAGISPAAFANRAYRSAADVALRYTSVPVGTYVTQVYSSTAVPNDLSAAPATSMTLTLTEGKIYTIYSYGLARTRTLSVGTVQHN